MSIPTTTPSPADDAFEGGPLDDAGFETMRADAVHAGRAMSSGEFLAGLIANGLLKTVGRPDKLPSAIWPDQDPVVVQEIWQLGLAVGLHAGRRSDSPAHYRDEMARVSAALSEAGFHAMAGLVARSRRLVAPEHPADGEAGNGH
ncbi:hypothetical protein B0E38_02572 [Streptomyces sp. 111WW2]|uniref:hypothetical protein n=1 Tax=unclassified Streptomyces TaxID=2593676 RepID=UPI000D0C9203|nr:hypothetical protein [Streptomyces sp. 111WW2]PSK57041.1 hypothetical protein B0E38_02572 [Streptomyces sp. 111WW2]